MGVRDNLHRCDGALILPATAWAPPSDNPRRTSFATDGLPTYNESVSMAGSATIPPDRVAAEAWRRLSRAADDPSTPMRVVTLGTVSPEGNPAARLMILRGADGESGRIWCHSRRESAKIADLRGNPFFAAGAYDAVDFIQMRLSGSARVH